MKFINAQTMSDNEVESWLKINNAKYLIERAPTEDNIRKFYGTHKLGCSSRIPVKYVKDVTNYRVSKIIWEGDTVSSFDRGVVWHRPAMKY